VGTGKGFTTTVVVAVLWHPFEFVTVSVYIPDIATVALADTVGLWVVAVNPFGPVHEYDVIPAGPPVSVSNVPTHTGPLLDAVAAGRAFTITVVVAASLHPGAFVTVSVYIPAIAAVALVETTGFWSVEVKPFGPVQL
jgi:hypothetical protein